MDILLKKDYIELEKRHSRFIKKWEYKNSPFHNDTKFVIRSTLPKSMERKG
jgi:hypothetical protein